MRYPIALRSAATKLPLIVSLFMGDERMGSSHSRSVLVDKRPKWGSEKVYSQYTADYQLTVICRDSGKAHPTAIVWA